MVSRTKRDLRNLKQMYAVPRTSKDGCANCDRYFAVEILPDEILEEETKEGLCYNCWFEYFNQGLNVRWLNIPGQEERWSCGCRISKAVKGEWCEYHSGISSDHHSNNLPSQNSHQEDMDQKVRRLVERGGGEVSGVPLKSLIDRPKTRSHFNIFMRLDPGSLDEDLSDRRVYGPLRGQRENRENRENREGQVKRENRTKQGGRIMLMEGEELIEE